jgi:hypothetical protein
MDRENTTYYTDKISDLEKEQAHFLKHSKEQISRKIDDKIYKCDITSCIWEREGTIERVGEHGQTR